MTKTIPSRENLNLLLEQEEPVLSVMIAQVNSTIKEYKLPWKIEKINGKHQLVDIGESTDSWLNRFITENDKMLQLKEDVRKLAPLTDEVLISGETGTGKEIIARALHGERKGKFVAVNCAGLPEYLVESELFGHEGGAFTGATAKAKIGLFASAEDGTAFLDEIGELSMYVQAKLLRTLQEKRIRKVGANREEAINCRFVAATNRNLKEMCKAGTFRLDLFARISTFELDTIPLRERPEDITPIIKSLYPTMDIFEYLNKTKTTPDLILNVRSLQAMVRRYKVLGKI